jgi:sorting nexin-25
MQNAEITVTNVMHALLNTQTVVIVGALAILLPVVSRIVSSPVTLFLISPFLLFLFAIVFLASSIRLGHYLDAKRSPARRHLSHASRPFAFSTPAAWQVVLTRSQWSHKSPSSFSPLYPESPAISSELNDILSMVIKDFVRNWYKDLSSSPSFPNAVSTIIHDSLERLLDQAMAIDICSLVVKRILPKITAHIDQFRQSEVTLRGAGLERRLTQSEELDLLLASRYCTNGGEKLHPAVDNLSTTFTKQTEEMHLRQLVEKALPFVLPDRDVLSKALRIVAREIVACSVLYPVMEMLTDPDFWNRAIDQVVSVHVIGASPCLFTVSNSLRDLMYDRLELQFANSESFPLSLDSRQSDST